MLECGPSSPRFWPNSGMSAGIHFSIQYMQWHNINAMNGNSTGYSWNNIYDIKVRHYWPFVRGIHRWPPSQRASNSENDSMSWRHHELWSIVVGSAPSWRDHCVRIKRPLVNNLAELLELKFSPSQWTLDNIEQGLTREQLRRYCSVLCNLW